MKKANGGVAARVKHTRKFTGRRVNKGERRKAKIAPTCGHYEWSEHIECGMCQTCAAMFDTNFLRLVKGD